MDCATERMGAGELWMVIGRTGKGALEWTVIGRMGEGALEWTIIGRTGEGALEWTVIRRTGEGALELTSRGWLAERSGGRNTVLRVGRFPSTKGSSPVREYGGGG